MLIIQCLCWSLYSLSGAALPKDWHILWAHEFVRPLLWKSKLLRINSHLLYYFVFHRRKVVFENNAETTESIKPTFYFHDLLNITNMHAHNHWLTDWPIHSPIQMFKHLPISYHHKAMQIPKRSSRSKSFRKSLKSKNVVIYLCKAIKGIWLTNSLTDINYQALPDVWPIRFVL